MWRDPLSLVPGDLLALVTVCPGVALNPPMSYPVSPRTWDPCHSVPRGGLDSTVPCHPYVGPPFLVTPHQGPCPMLVMSRGWQGHPLTPYPGSPCPLSPHNQRWPQSPMSPVTPYPGMEDRGQGHHVPVIVPG